jgi:peptidoglycan/xylan/chitin deacetylase (PgdA/CDA1 family)
MFGTFVRKRELLARGLFWTGVSSLLSQLPARDSLLVLNYHRIGNPDDDPFDPGVFSATGDQLNEQISYLKRHVSMVTLQEAQAFCDGTLSEKTPRCRVLITFDDGYLDNYQVGFPILRSHGVQGLFFLATSMVGSCSVPWWDHIAFLMKTARQRRFSLHYPADLAVDVVENGMTKSLRDVLSLYKRPGNADPERFIRELKEKTQGDDLPGTLRRFLNWDEAREMIAGGMAIGSHTHSHTVLSQLGPEQQRHELVQSRATKRKSRLQRRRHRISGWRYNVLLLSDQVAGPGGWLPHCVLVLWRHQPAWTDRSLRCEANRRRRPKSDSLPSAGRYLQNQRSQEDRIRDLRPQASREGCRFRPRFATSQSCRASGGQGSYGVLFVLRNTQRVPVGIPEPRDFTAPRRCPDPEIILLHGLIMFEANACRRQSLGRCLDARHFPSEHGISCGVHLLDDGDAKHRAVCVVNQGERHLFLDEWQPQSIAVELSRAIGIGSGDESDDAVVTEPELFCHEAIMTAMARCRKTRVAP